jgi:hypothetical protein
VPHQGYLYVSQAESQKDWEAAHSAAIIQDVLAVFGRGTPDLLPFEEVRKRLRLHQKYYKGLQDIELRRIRGSVGRYRDFTGTFLPRMGDLRERWQRVGALAHTRGLPPIEVYQVGEAYFVLDGNHRVSIARQLGSDTIQAHVWEYPTPIGLSADADLDELIITAERMEFLERTQLDKTRPGHNIIFTAPGRYPEIAYQIGLYQGVLEQIDGEPFTYEQAAEAWYDMLYTPAVQIIQQRGILERFPGRTEADLFVWVWRHNQQLRARRRGAHLSTVADDLARPGWQKALSRLWEVLTGWLRRTD